MTNKPIFNLVTPALIEAIAGGPVSNLTDRPLAQGYNEVFPDYGIVTPKRVVEFLAQVCQETQGFTRFIERGNGDKDGDGWDDYLAKYDFRKDLGNHKIGHGEMYRGRGGFHHTGLDNYIWLSDKIGVDFVNKPWLLAEIRNFVKADCLYWNRKGLNTFADQSDTRGITYRINGGYNGHDNRMLYVRRGKRFLGI